MDTSARYVVGIDLGTTNSAVTYVDTDADSWRIATLGMPQVVAPGMVETRETLPSFHYQPVAGELADKALQLPFGPPDTNYTVGVFARDHGAQVPGRMIGSAKSWLCHAGVDRTDAFLPWHGAIDVDRLSPIDVSARILGHIRAVWDATFAEEPLCDQDIILTLPASFDEIARELTIRAAAQAGLPRVVLIEEPQAAFYAWLDRHPDHWDQMVQPGQKILVCDIGGGTTDLTLIQVRRGQKGEVQFHRVAVGDHWILGGDNLDLALAQHIERRLVGSADRADGTPPPATAGPTGRKLEIRQWSVLVGACRTVKEQLLGPDAPERLAIHLPGAGSQLMGGGIQVEVTRAEVHRVLLEGFFPIVDLNAKPIRTPSGFQEFGLPYAPDPAVTRYLAAFLTAHRQVSRTDGEEPQDHDPARPDIVLFNGGVFAAPSIRERVLAVLSHWFGGSEGPWQPTGSSGPAVTGSARGRSWAPEVLDNDRLDLAVARGAAYYGMVRRGHGVRIAAGLARTYYIGVASAGEPRTEPEPNVTVAPKTEPEQTGFGTPSDMAEVVSEPLPRASDPVAICLVPAGVEPGQDIELAGHRFHLLVSEPVEFPLYVSSSRLTDRPGQLIPVNPESMTALPPIRTVLRAKKRSVAEVVTVQLHARLTEIGTLDLGCHEMDGRRRWRLQFDVRSTTQTDRSAHESAAEGEGFLDEATWDRCRDLIRATFAPGGEENPAGLVKRLARAIGTNRNEWPASLCRRIWEALMDCESGRHRSAAHEARWLNLLGFALRPGHGMAIDDWRVAQTWRCLWCQFVHAAVSCRAEGWILWRRIGGGLSAGQQQALADPLLGLVRSLHRQLMTGRGTSDFSYGAQETAEVWRLLGSLELLPTPIKIELGGLLLDLYPKRKMEPVRQAMAWAIGRMGARIPIDGPLNAVVPIDVVTVWLEQLMARCPDDPMGCLAVMQMARWTDDRYRDIPADRRATILGWLDRNNAPRHFIELVERGGRLDHEEQNLVFGEALPKGLMRASPVPGRPGPR